MNKIVELSTIYDRQITRLIKNLKKKSVKVSSHTDHTESDSNMRGQVRFCFLGKGKKNNVDHKIKHAVLAELYLMMYSLSKKDINVWTSTDLSTESYLQVLFDIKRTTKRVRK